MKRKITNILMALGVFSALVVAPVAAAVDVQAAAPAILADTVDQARQGVNKVGGGGGQGLGAFLKQIINILLFIIGAISVIMIIIGGLRYVLSGGDANSIKAGKDSVLYAIIGLVVALMAYAIVNFVLDSL